MTRPTFVVILGLAILALLPGCKWYTYQDTTVLVTDGETGEPLPNAEVGVQAIAMFTFNLPEDIFVKTDDSGTAKIKLVDNHPYFLDVGAEGYRGLGTSDRWLRRPNDESPMYSATPQASHVTLTEADPDDGHDTAQLHIKLFRDPPPSLRVVVPNGYRGLIKIHLVRYPGDSPDLPTERVHEITTNARGEASLIEQHLFWNHFDRRDQIIVVEGGREYPLVRSRSGGLAASFIELRQVPGLLIHLGDENDHARDVPTIPGRRRGSMGSVEITRLPRPDEMRRFMHGARQETPQ
ncbi:MAG: hypothetical protein AAF593_05475 [Planctomycetota bacterium]